MQIYTCDFNAFEYMFFNLCESTMNMVNLIVSLIILEIDNKIEIKIVSIAYGIAAMTTYSFCYNTSNTMKS